MLFVENQGDLVLTFFRSNKNAIPNVARFSDGVDVDLMCHAPGKMHSRHGEKRTKCLDATFDTYLCRCFISVFVMHSEATTDLSILYAKLNSAAPSQQNVVLIKTGALNPIHRSHISNLIKTKEHLERVYGINVIGGYLSPTHDDYVQNKLGSEWITGEHRIAMCQKAIEDENQQHWLGVDKAECMGKRYSDLEEPPGIALSQRGYLTPSMRSCLGVCVISPT